MLTWGLETTAQRGCEDGHSPLQGEDCTLRNWRFSGWLIGWVCRPVCGCVFAGSSIPAARLWYDAWAALQASSRLVAPHLQLDSTSTMFCGSVHCCLSCTCHPPAGYSAPALLPFICRYLVGSCLRPTWGGILGRLAMLNRQATSLGLLYAAACLQDLCTAHVSDCVSVNLSVSLSAGSL